MNFGISMCVCICFRIFLFVFVIMILTLDLVEVARSTQEKNISGHQHIARLVHYQEIQFTF